MAAAVRLPPSALAVAAYIRKLKGSTIVGHQGNRCRLKFSLELPSDDPAILRELKEAIEEKVDGASVRFGARTERSLGELPPKDAGRRDRKKG